MHQENTTVLFPGCEGSGVLLVACDSGRIGLLRRSGLVHIGNCWGMAGGTVEENECPRETAMRELREETAYMGDVRLRLAYIFRVRTFCYYNYIGIVKREFSFEPTESGFCEHHELRWFAHSHLCQLLTTQPTMFHFGVRRLFNNADVMISTIIQECNPLNTTTSNNFH